MTQKQSRFRLFVIFALCLLGILLALFHQSFLPGKIFFSNDGPLGYTSQNALELPTAFTGVWYDLNSIGVNGGTSMPDLSGVWFWLLGPIGFAKFFAPLVLLFLGCCAWFFFRQLRLNAAACFIGGLAVTLNSGFFSTGCLGVGQQIVAGG